MAGRSSNGDGSVTRIITTNGEVRWRAQVTVQDDLGRKSRVSRRFTTKTEAKEFVREAQREGRVEAARAKKELTLGEWFDWLAANDWPETLAPTTLMGRVCRFDKHVRPTWGNVALIHLDPLRIKAFYRSLATSGVSTANVQEIKRDLVRVFNLAIKPYHRVPWTCGNPFTLPVPASPPREAIALTPEEAKVALRHTDLRQQDRALLGVFVLAGLRLGEAMALTKDQVDFERGLIRVDRAVRMDWDRSQTIGLPKGGKKRVAILCPTLAGILSPLCETAGEDGLLWTAEGRPGPRLKRNVYRTWREILALTGLPSEMSPHDGRLTHVNWIEKLLPLVSPTTLKEHVGHSSGRSVTELSYTRPLPPAQDLLRDGLEGLIGLTTGTPEPSDEP